MDSFIDLPSEIKMHIVKFVGSPTAALIKEYTPRTYSKKFWIKYDKWVWSWRDYNTSKYEVEYWSMMYHKCCISDVKFELLYGIKLME